MSLILDEQSARPHYLQMVSPDGRLITVLPLTFGRARVGIGDQTGFDNVW